MSGNKCLFACWVLVSLLSACFLVECLFPCWVLASLLSACFLVECLFPCWVPVSLLSACFLVECLFPCRMLVSSSGACFLVGCLFPCRVKVWRARTPTLPIRLGRATTTRNFSQPPGPCPIAPRDEITSCGETPHSDLESGFCRRSISESGCGASTLRGFGLGG